MKSTFEDPGATPDPELHRRRLAGFVDAARANPPPGMRVRTEAELDESLSGMLQAHPPAHDLDVFGYGSLMWNPALAHSRAQKARVLGWHRRFCLRQYLGRGAPDAPGVTLALDRGGSCYGVAYRIPAARVREELRALWRREMAFGAYEARWLSATCEDGALTVLTFVANRSSERYLGKAGLDQIAQLVRTGKGTLGTSRDYFESSLHSLLALGVTDAGMERLRLAVLQADENAAARQ